MKRGPVRICFWCNLTETSAKNQYNVNRYNPPKNRIELYQDTEPRKYIIAWATEWDEAYKTYCDCDKGPLTKEEFYAKYFVCLECYQEWDSENRQWELKEEEWKRQSDQQLYDEEMDDWPMENID